MEPLPGSKTVVFLMMFKGFGVQGGPDPQDSPPHSYPGIRGVYVYKTKNLGLARYWEQFGGLKWEDPE